MGQQLLEDTLTVRRTRIDPEEGLSENVSNTASVLELCETCSIHMLLIRTSEFGKQQIHPSDIEKGNQRPHAMADALGHCDFHVSRECRQELDTHQSRV